MLQLRVLLMCYIVFISHVIITTYLLKIIGVEKE